MAPLAYNCSLTVYKATGWSNMCDLCWVWLVVLSEIAFNNSQQNVPVLCVCGFFVVVVVVAFFRLFHIFV